MATSRVGEVRLRLRVPATLAAQTDQIRATVENELLRQILEQLERLLHARFGEGAVIRIRRIATRWNLDALELTRIDVVMRLAAELAEVLMHELEALSPGDRLRPRSETVALFASESHAIAAYLADVVDGIAPATWIHTQRDPQRAWTAVTDAGDAAVVETLRYLVAMERLEAALLLAPPEIVEQLASAAPAELAPALRVARARRGVRDAAVRAPAIESAPPRDPVRVVDASSPPAIDAPPAGSPVHAAPMTGVAPVAPGETGDTDETAPAAPHESIEVAPAQSTTSTDASVTAFAGLFYLAGRVLEIELAERLWAAGLPEGDVLVHIAAAIVGTTEDPAPAYFGGVLDRAPAIPDVPAWAMAEICETVQHALGRRLVRHGITSSPALLDEQLEALAREVRVPAVSPNLQRVIARGVAALCTIVAARLARPPSLVELRALCTRPGRLAHTDEVLHVIMSDACIDIDHRRAGLDHNPGRLPWLGRDLKIEFTTDHS